MIVPIEDRLKAVFADVFETTADAITEDLSVDSDPAWDSMQSIVLASSVESEFEVQFTDAELVELDSFSKILTALKRRQLAGDPR